MKHTLYSQLDRMVTDRWAWHSLRRLLRACWIGLCVCCIGLGGSLVWGWPMRLEWLGAAALACIAVALATMLRPRMRPEESARRLDRRFGLNEQLATAIEVAASNPQPGTVGAQLVSQATRTARGLRQHVRKQQRMPWLEMLTLLAIGIAAAGLFLLSGIGSPWLSGQAAALPPLPQAADPADLFPDEPPESSQQTGLAAGEESALGGGDQAGSTQAAGAGGEAGDQQGAGTQQSSMSQADRQAMEALADALRDQGATRPAAEALDRGDANRAAQELRALADQAGQLSEASRGDLSDNLREAARTVERAAPQMADQMRDSASGLEGGRQEASQALDDLAQAIDEMAGGQAGQGQQAGQQGEQAGQGQAGQAGDQSGQGQQGGQAGSAGNAPGGQQRPVQPERLGVDGRPVELSAEGGGQQGAEPARPGTTVPGGTGSTGGGDPGAAGAVGPDPLRIPLDERDVVQEYFNP